MNAYVGFRRLLPVLLLAAAVGGCSLRTTALRTTAHLLDRGATAFYEEPDPVLARETMPGQLKLLEALLQNGPRNRRLLKALAEGFAGYAFLFLEDEYPDRAREFYKRAAGYGLRLLARNKRLAGLDRMQPDDMSRALRSAGRKDVPGLYWTATAWAGWANMAKNDAEALAAVPKAVRLMRRVLELEPGYQFGGPDLFFGVYYAARPRLAGGDPDKAKAHLDAALARTGRRFLTAQLLAMKYYAVAVLDDALFRNLYDEIQEAPAGGLPAARLADEVAKIKSKNLMEQIDDLF
ncbi:MAG: TRAP transporter TatT component family protein [Elusimicrobiota bacterium]